MKVRKPTNDDVSYVDRKLLVLRDQIDKAERYLSENPWDKIEDSIRERKNLGFKRACLIA